MNGTRPGFHTITPYIMVKDATGLVAFVQQVFGATETFRAQGEAGGIHIEMQIGNSMLMIGGAVRGPQMPAALYVYVDDVDGAYQRALVAGATSLMDAADQDDGDRRVGVQDRFGNQWFIATHHAPK